MIPYVRVMSVYIELYILDNLLMDVLVLRLGAAVVGRRCVPKRLTLFALMGCAFAVVALFWPPLLHPAAKVAQGLVLALFIRPQSIRQYLENAAAVLLSAYCVGGAALALGSGTGSGIVVMSEHMRLMLISALVALMLPRTIRRLRTQRSVDTLKATLCAVVDGKRYELTALRDSGCFLTEPVSGTAVVTAYIEELLPQADIPIPIETLNGTGIIYALRPDSMTIDGIDTDALLAISPKPIRGAQAIIPYHIAKESAQHDEHDTKAIY